MHLPGEWWKRICGYRSPVIHPESRVGNRFRLEDGTSARRLETVPLPEHEPAFPAFGRNLRQPAPFGMEAFPKVFQVVCDLFLRPSDGGGDFLCRKGTFLQKGAKLMPYGFRFPRYLKGRPCVVSGGFVSHDGPILSKRNRQRDIASYRTARRRNSKSYRQELWIMARGGGERMYN